MKIGKKKGTLFLVIFTMAVAICLAGRGYKVMAAENTEKKVSIVPADVNQGLFSDKDGFWYPGRTLSKDFVIKNDYEKEIEFKKISVNIQSVSNFILLKIYNPDEDIYKQFLQNLKVQLKDKDKDKIVFDGNFADFSSTGVNLSESIKVAAKSNKTYTLTFHFEESAGNIFQDLQNLFNLSIVYTMDDGTKVVDDITKLPQTGGFLNTTTLITLGLTFSGLGFLLLGYREDRKKKTSLSRGGNNYA